ncbi:MAG: CHAD domain-containing protein, partial [Pseudomonadota bacterium]
MNKTSLSLNPELPLRDSVTGLIHAELAGAETALTSGSPPTDEAVYAARKTIKRLRSIVRLARPALGKTQYRAWNTELRDLGRMLAGARDRAALVETAVDLASRVRGPDAPSQASRTRLVRLTQEHGSLMAGESHTAEAAAKAADIVADLRYQAIDWKKWTDHEVLRAGLATAHGRGVELLREAFA